MADTNNTQLCEMWRSRGDDSAEWRRIHSSAATAEAARFSEISVSLYQTIGRHIPKDSRRNWNVDENEEKVDFVLN
jgi:hypothetical protein